MDLTSLPGFSELAPSGIATTMQTIGLLLFAVSLPLIFIELGWLSWRKNLTWTRLKEMLASYSTVPPLVLSTGLATALWLGIYMGVSALTPFSIETTWATALICLLLADFTYYWDHRMGHEVNGLWSLYHSVHHSSPVFDQSTAFRISFVDQFVVPVFYVPLVIAGFDPLLVAASQLVVVAYQSWIHTEMVGKLGWLDVVINTPSTHRVHHAAQPQYRDKNYGGILMIWDHLFGTYERESQVPAYGLVTPIESRNPISVHVCELMRLRRKLSAAKDWSLRWRLIAKRPDDGDGGTLSA
jgi:sterol desaturase/sphingolipid hydroxylase (fatty acid hydroxylase superfamily)